MTRLLNALSTTSAALRARARAFARDQRGGFALWTAALVPGISVLALGAVELGKVSGDRSQMQDAADMAALAGATQLAVGVTGATERAEAIARAQLGRIAQEAREFTVTASLGASNSMVVEITATRTSFFGNLLPPGGFYTKVRAAASGMTQEPICVLGVDSAFTPSVIEIRDSSTVTADCTVHANKDITVATTARLTAHAVQAVGVASGPITPAGRSGAETVADPFASRVITTPACPWMDERAYSSGYIEVDPGVYCGDYELSGTVHVHMKPGTYYFMGASAQNAGKVSLKGQARLTGTDVTMIFAKTSKLYVTETAKLDLKAPRTGTNAGMLIMATRDNNKTFEFMSPSVDRLEGVIYLPGAQMIVDGAGQIAEQSKWTIAVVKALKVEHAAQLVVHTDYAGSEVPRPAQVNSGVGTARLLPSTGATGPL